MNTPINANDFLMAGGAKSAKFEQIGAFASGRITEPPTVQQQKDFTSGEPLFWTDGQPRMQLVVSLATDQRDASDADDDGTRRIYVKGQMKNAVQQAVRAAGARGLEVGGVLKVTYVRDGQASNPRFNAPKEYAAEYIPAAQAEFDKPDPQQVPAGVNPHTGEITSPAPAPAAAPGALNPNDPAVQALLAQLQGGQAPVPAQGGNPPF